MRKGEEQLGARGWFISLPGGLVGSEILGCSNLLFLGASKPREGYSVVKVLQKELFLLCPICFQLRS